MSRIKNSRKLLLAVVVAICAIGYCAPVEAYDIEIPTFLYTSGSARLIGMGDASVAIIDASGYNTNPGALPLQTNSITASFSVGGVSRIVDKYGSVHISVGNIPLWRMSGKWSCGFSAVSQTLADRYSYFKSGRPDTDQNISGVVFGGTEYQKAISIPKESFRSLAIGIGHKGRTQIGLGIAARNVRLYASRLDPRYTQNQFLDGWSFDFGIISRWIIEPFSAQPNPTSRSLEISPSVGFKCLGLYRTDVSKEYLTDLLSDFLVEREPVYGGPPGIIHAGDRTIHTGAALTATLKQSNLSLAALTMALEIQGGGRNVAHGSKEGVEFSFLETASIRFGHGVYGDQYDIGTWGCSLSSTGLQKLLHHTPVDATVSSRQSLLSRLHLTVSYANNKHVRSTTVPDDYWTISLSL